MLNWKKDNRPYSNGYYGFKNRIRCFWVGWEVTLKEQYEKPYLMECYLPSLKLNKERFKTEEEARQYCERILKVFIKELTK